MSSRFLAARLLLTASLGACVPLGMASRAAGDVTIVVDPGSLGSIEEAAVAEAKVNWWDENLADDVACTESFAATELRDLLPKAADVSSDGIRLAPPDRMPDQGQVILLTTGDSNPLVGKVSESEALAVPGDNPGSFRIKAFSRDGRTITIIRGRDRAGTLYGAYAYLEQLGVRFHGLGEQGTVYPAARGPLPRELDVAEQPDYLTRGFWTWEDRGDRTFFTWMARNRLNFWCVASERDLHFNKKVGMKLTAGGHVIQDQCLSPEAAYPYDHAGFTGDEGKPADPYQPGPQPPRDADGDGKLSYFEAHPEWFGLVNGRRSDRINRDFGDNYCTSNGDATAELVRNVVRECIDGAWRDVDVLNFWMLDVGKWCECDACKAQGIYTDRLMLVVDATLKGLAKARAEGRLKREVEIATLAYHETLPPPTRPLPADFDYDHCSVTFFPIERCYVHPLADPACTEINRKLQEDFLGWTTGTGRHYTGAIFIGEYYNVSLLKSLPVLFPRIMAADIPWYHRNGARHFHYMHAPTRLWGTWTLNQYLMARLLWDTDTDVDQLLGEYFGRHYPTTSEQTREFYRELEYATANCKAYKHYVYTAGQQYGLRSRLMDSNKGEIFTLEHLRYEPYHPTLNDGPDLVEIVDAMRRARRHLDDALLACRDATEKARLIEDERRFAYGQAMIDFIYHMARVAMFQRRSDPEQARREFELAERDAAILERIVDLVQVASSHANAENGLKAATLDGVYKVFKERYGSTRPGP